MMVQSEHKSRGALIVLEGLDRAGKSTQCEQLCAALDKEGRNTKRIRFPGMCVPLFCSWDRLVESA